MVLFEVEQKFSWTTLKLTKLYNSLHHPTLPPPFNASKFQYHVFRDAYYDYHQTLSKNGLWVRKRLVQPEPWKWEAKQSKPSNHKHNPLRTSFKETNDTSEILTMIRTYIPTAPDHSHNFGLEVMCDFNTWRYSFLADGKFNVVLDETGFGHRVGEIEVMAEDTEKAHKEIESFRGEHGWLFGAGTGGEVKGKLTAWFEKFGRGDTEDEGDEVGDSRNKVR